MKEKGAAELAVSSVSLAVGMEGAPRCLAARVYLRARVAPKRVGTHTLDLPELPNKAVDVVIGFEMLTERNE
jgi:hypothetical protein